MVQCGRPPGEPELKGPSNSGDGVPASWSAGPVAVLTKTPSLTCDVSPFPLTKELSVIRSHFPGPEPLDITWGLVVPKKSTSSVLYVDPPDYIAEAVPLLRRRLLSIM